MLVCASRGERKGEEEDEKNRHKRRKLEADRHRDGQREIERSTADPRGMKTWWKEQVGLNGPPVRQQSRAYGMLI